MLAARRTPGVITFDSSFLLDYYQAKTGQLGAATNALISATTKKTPTAPWAASATAPKASDMVKTALAGKALINEGAAKLDVAGASADYRKLFALYQGLNALSAVVDRAGATGVSATEMGQLSKTFTKGLAEVSTYAEGLKLDNLRLTRGASIDMLPSQLSSPLPFGKADTDVGVAQQNVSYTTGQVHSGGLNDVVANFAGAVSFNITVKKVNTAENVGIDLADMGATARTLPNVVNFINGKLAAVGAVTRFATEKLPTEARSITVNGKAVPLPPGPDRWAMKVKGDIGEQVSFSAPAAAGAVYLAQTAGRADDLATKDVNEQSYDRQLLKFQTDQLAGADAPPDVVAQDGEAFRVDGRVFAKSLGANVQAVRASAAAADGSVYVLADVNGTTDGQSLKGSQDVALLKYDSTGQLLYARTLGAADKASGLALAVSADGKVAVAGSITGNLDGDSGVDAAKTDSFVTVFSKAGDELWTQRRGAREDDEATSVAFGADGSVYVAGRARSNMPGSAAVGGWDGYVEGFTGTPKPLGGYTVATKFVSQFGTGGTDGVSGMALSGNILVTAGVENGHAVLRRFDLQASGAPVAAAVSDLGDLQGGAIAGVSFNGADLVVAGTTRNGALNAASISAAHHGGTDAFVATVSAGDLSADTLTYLGGAGDDSASALTVSGGDVWLAGAAGAGTVGGMAQVGTQTGAKDGYLARLDTATGAVEWGRRFTAKDGQAAPTSIAVDPTGATALDRMGLPQGPMSFTDSQLLVSATSLRAGDQFQIRTDEGGRPGTVTISADDTLQSLAAKISRASGFRVKVQVVKDGDFQRLQIKPSSSKATVEILGGGADRNALEAIGLPEGVVRVKPTDTKTFDKDKVYGLTLNRDLSLDTKEGLKAAKDQLQTALSTIRTAYRDLDKLFNPTSAVAAAAAAKPSAYMTDRIKNYQAALDRLTGAA